MMENDLKIQQEKLTELVTDRTKELEHALQVKSRFLATMSHGNKNFPPFFIDKFKYISLPITNDHFCYNFFLTNSGFFF